MNKFTRLILTSAIFATSGFATDEATGEDLTNIAEGATLNVPGLVTANTDLSVNGTLNIKGGSIANNAITVKIVA